MSDLIPIDASITRLQTALFCSNPVGIDQEVSDDVRIDVQNSLSCFSDHSEYRCQGRPLNGVDSESLLRIECEYSEGNSQC